LANTDTLIPLGSITLLRLHLVDIHVHDSISTFAPSTDPSFSNLHSADSTNIPFFFLPDTAKHLYHHTFTPLIHPNFYRYATFVESRLHTRICETHTHSITHSFSQHRENTTLHDQLQSVWAPAGAFIAKTRDLGRNSKHVGHVARRRGHQDVLDTKPYRVKLCKQHFCIPPATAEKHPDTATKKPKATTRYSGSISHAGDGI
jgi:hypothetical protein